MARINSPVCPQKIFKISVAKDGRFVAIRVLLKRKLHASSGLRRNHLDLDAVLRAGQSRAVDGGSSWGVAGYHPLLPSAVHLGKCVHVGEPDGGRQDMAFVTAAEREQSVNAGQRLPSLDVDVGSAAIVGHLTSEVHGVLVNDGLGQSGASFNSLNVHGVVLG